MGGVPVFSVPGETNTRGITAGHHQPLLLLLQPDLPEDPEDVDLWQQDGGLHGVPGVGLVLPGQHDHRGELQVQLHGEVPGGAGLRVPGCRLRSQHQTVQHVQVSPLQCQCDALKQPLADFSFIGRLLKLLWAETETLITWRITAFTVRRIFRNIQIQTFQPLPWSGLVNKLVAIQTSRL